MIETLLEVLLELLIAIVSEFATALGWESLDAATRTESRGHRALAFFGYALIGGVLGALSAVVLPHRVVPHLGLSAITVLFNTALFGFVMSVRGHRRHLAGKPCAHLSTFWGGATFAFAVSAGRHALLNASAG